MGVTDTRRSLHAVAELLLAGPQYLASDTIKLRVTPGGFGTRFSPVLRVDVADLVSETGRFPLHGATIASLAAQVGVEAGAPAGLYGDGSGGSPEAVLTVDAADAAQLAAVYQTGDDALRLLAPTEVPVLWPEHFDLAIRVDEANFGVSAGDTFLEQPYAYVGAEPVRGDAFWNAPFGAARPMTEFPDAAALLAFFRDGRNRQLRR